MKYGFGNGSVEKFRESKKELWCVSNEVAGYKKCIQREEEGRFCYFALRNSRHEATSYVPRNAWPMQEEFIGRVGGGKECSENEGRAAPLLDL